MTLPLLQIVVASTRTGRTGPVIADWFTGLAREHGGFRVEVADLAALDLPFFDDPNAPIDGAGYTDARTKQWSITVDESDAFVFVAPEYNRGFIAPLKNALDVLYPEWGYKPAGIVSYGMSSAGMRAAQMLEPVLTALQMTPVSSSVRIHLRQFLDTDGRPRPDRAQESAARDMLDEIHRVGGALATLRAPRADRLSAG